jgi:uncharacterized protein YjlB
MEAPGKNTTVKHFYLKDDGTFPNNALLPVLLYRSAWKLPWLAVRFIKRKLKEHFWGNAWKNGVFDYQHYHSKAHEVLCVYKGSTRLLLGGNNGIIVEVEAGDVVIIPAGVAHKNMDPSRTFKCVGAYPQGQNYDMKYGRFIERPQSDEDIAKVSLPKEDPVFGNSGPLVFYWKIS